MKTNPGFYTVKELVELRKQDVAKPNPEYQRGVVWTRRRGKSARSGSARKQAKPSLPVISLDLQFLV